jgi:hypothetical protein
MFLVALVLLTWATGAQAHHILGLPHYAYKDNYPQVPVLEYPARSGPWDILLTSYPGRPIPGEAANLSFYIKDGVTSAIYPETVAIRVLRKGNFGSSEEILASTTVEAFDQLYKLTATMPEDGDYVVELSLMVEGQLEVIPFLLVAGEPKSPWGPVAAIVFALLLFVVVIRAIKIKRQRREAA